ncbi:MAG: hypothetical protein Q6373_023835 [Candidatus Sigynarchaeota archaeon]
MAQFTKSIWEKILGILKQIGLILSAILVMALVGSGIGLAIILRAWGLDYTSIVLPSLIIEVIGCIIAYQFSSNFFPKVSRDYEGRPSKKSSTGYREPEEIEAPPSDKVELPERKVKS